MDDGELFNHHGKPVRQVRPVKQDSFPYHTSPVSAKPSLHPRYDQYNHIDQMNWYPNSVDINHTSPGPLSDVQLAQFVHIWKHPNGGASVVQMDQDEFKHLSPAEMGQLADLFFRETFHEDSDGCARHVMGIVRNAASYLPELVSHFAEHHPDVVVKMGHLKQDRKSEIETSNFAEYAERVRASYNCGTFRCGPLLQVSLVQPHSEEAGKYFPDFLGEYSAMCYVLVVQLHLCVLYLYVYRVHLDLL